MASAHAPTTGMWLSLVHGWHPPLGCGYRLRTTTNVWLQLAWVLHMRRPLERGGYRLHTATSARLLPVQPLPARGHC
ncbi:hypothetical protein B296_00023190 [Ensete ventricosum]|uniref:Uncharacterized protein n=1 Tax=Ensete ventricosum TaxID=4639 RepID=A0A427AVJ9_ENSVE|nr:hypothetical protein B296_00023190 [Ensete ventricosum]